MKSLQKKEINKYEVTGNDIFKIKMKISLELFQRDIKSLPINTFLERKRRSRFKQLF